MSTNGNAKKRKITRLEEQCSKITDNKPIDEKFKSTVKFFKTSKAESGKRYSMARKKQTSSKKLKLKSRNLAMSFVLAVFMLCVLFTSNSDVLSAYFTDIKNINNPFSVDAEYTVTFDSNTGTGTMPAQIVSYNVATPLNANTFTKTDYVFTGWNTSANGTGTAYAPGASITNLGDITLYAQWIESTNCTVTFVYGDETFDGTNYINSGIPLFSSDNIHRDFEVRSTISNFTVNPGQDTNRNALICNQNEVKDPYPGFALSYREDKDTDGGKAIKIQGNCTSTAQAMFLWGKTSGTIVITRTDDKLYYDDNNFLVDYANLVTPFNAPLSFGANLDQNGNPRRFAKVTMSDTEVKITYSLSEIPTLVLPTPTKTGFTFDGWYTDPVGGTQITTPTIAQLANKKIYAHWGNYYMVNFDSNGGSGTMASQRIDYGVTTPLNANTFTKVGAEFTGWNTATNGTGTAYTDEEAVTDIGNTTLYAQWDEPIYKLTYVFGDESYDGTNYMDSDIALFSTANVHRYFDLTTSFSNYEYVPGYSNNRNVFITNHYEPTSPYQGFSLAYRDGKIQAQGNSTKSPEKLIPWGQTEGDIEFERINDVMYFNDQLLLDFSNIKAPFNQTLTFGATIKNGEVIRTGHADLSDLQITLDYTYSELINLTLPAPTKVGYTFDGWYTAETGGTKVTALTSPTYPSTKLYARWTANP